MNLELLSNNWHNCLSMMQKELSAEDFRKWIQPIKADSYDGATLFLAVPSREWANHIESNFMTLLISALRSEFSGIKSLRYVLSTEQKNSKPVDAPTAPTFGANSEPKRRVVIDPQLNFEHDFKNFVQGPCNTLARVTGLAVVESPGAPAFNPFVIYGDSGMGKTHLAQAVGIEIKKNDPQLKVLYVSMNKFLDQFTTATRKKEISNFVNFYQMIDVLIIDDIHELSGRPGTQAVMFSIFNHLHLNGKQLIFTCDRPLTELTDIENRLITRFKWGITVPVTKPDYNTKVKIIESKSLKHNLNLPSDVLDYIANSIDGSVREIEGVISSFMAHTRLLKMEPSMELAREIVRINIGGVTSGSAVTVQQHRGEVNVEKIQEAVCSFYNVSKSDLFSKKRTQEVAFARQVAMYLTKELTSMSLSSIGEAMGGKTHATVLHAHKSITNRIETVKEFANELSNVKSACLG